MNRVMIYIQCSILECFIYIIWGVLYITQNMQSHEQYKTHTNWLSWTQWLGHSEIWYSIKWMLAWGWVWGCASSRPSPPPSPTSAASGWPLPYWLHSSRRRQTLSPCVQLSPSFSWVWARWLGRCGCGLGDDFPSDGREIWQWTLVRESGYVAGQLSEGGG